MREDNATLFLIGKPRDIRTDNGFLNGIRIYIRRFINGLDITLYVLFVQGIIYAEQILISIPFLIEQDPRRFPCHSSITQSVGQGAYNIIDHLNVFLIGTILANTYRLPIPFGQIIEIGL